MRTRVGLGLIAGVLLPAMQVLAGGNDHPFALVRVISLNDGFSFVNTVGFVCNDGILGSCDANPGNVPPPSESRLGTQPCAVATDGTRMWIAGHYNGSGPLHPETPENTWYASVGIGEISNMFATQFPLIDRYEATMCMGPAVLPTDWFSGLDYDDATETLYVAFDNASDFSQGTLNFFNTSGVGEDYLTIQQKPSYFAAVDVNTNSAGFGDFKWRVDDPLSVAGTTRLTGGVSVDSQSSDWVVITGLGSGFAHFFDTSSGDAATIAASRFQARLDDGSPCVGNGYLNTTFDPTTGDLYSRTRNGVQILPRRPDPNPPNDPSVPFVPQAEAIIEPNDDPGSVADTLAVGDDVQVIALGAPTVLGSVIITPGPNGFLDTEPAAGDGFSANTIAPMVVGNTPASAICGMDPDGFLYQNLTQGQGIAYIESDNLVDLDEDLIVATSRPDTGPNQVKDIRFFNTNGDTVAELEIPCTPPAIPNGAEGGPSGLAFYDVDYHAPSGTLVVVQFEQQKAYVYQAQTVDGPTVHPFNLGATLPGVDLFDLARFQECFTRSEDDPNYAGTPSFNCQRLTADSDCDVDLDDWASVAEAVTGPVQ